ncbi:MAG: family 43 glycosylhydrolase [Actinomycetota bacterium]|nr:family 43 glycosylhydrolase [Actinomycetota bacterium]
MTVLILTLGGASALVSPVRAGLLPPLPVPPGVPKLPGPSGSHPSAAPPRPSRPPPSRCSDVSAPGAVGYALPIFPCDFPDPMILRARGAWFAYASPTGWEQGRRSVPILQSSDLRHWRYIGDALSGPPRWSSADLWSPSVMAWNGGYLMYFSAKHRGGGHCLAVATAAAPQGPFAPRRRIACWSRHAHGYIDPAPLVAPGHRLYMFFSTDSPRHAITVLRLSADGLRARGRPRSVLGVSSRWGTLHDQTVEAPSPVRRGGRYFLFYSAGSWSSDYRMSYAVARSPLGPYRDAAPVPTVGPSARLPAPGGGSVVAAGGGPGHSRATWLAFTAWSGPPGYGLGSERMMRIAPLVWSPRGRPHLVLSGG